jgi:hypothetical protein
VANACRFDFDQNLTFTGAIKIDLHHFERLASLDGNCGACSHDMSPVI